MKNNTAPITPDPDQLENLVRFSSPPSDTFTFFIAIFSPLVRTDPCECHWEEIFNFDG